LIGTDLVHVDVIETRIDVLLDASAVLGRIAAAQNLLGDRVLTYVLGRGLDQRRRLQLPRETAREYSAATSDGPPRALRGRSSPSISTRRSLAACRTYRQYR
jgi:hypothetical protein